MTPRFKLALASLVALALGTGLTWFLLGGERKHDADLGPAPESRTSEGPALGNTTIQGRKAPGSGPVTDVQPGGSHRNLIGSREPYGPDYDDPAFRAKKLAELLAGPSIPWKEVQRLLGIMTEPLSDEAKRALVHGLRTGPRGYVVEAIAVVRDGTLVDRLFELIDERGVPEPVRQAALLGLGRMQGANADDVAKSLESRLSGTFRNDVHLLSAIAQRGGGEAARAIVEYLGRQASRDVRAQAFDRFELGEDEEAVRVFQAALLDAKSPIVAEQLLTLVAKPGSAELVPAIAKLESGASPLGVRLAALKSLGRIGSTDAVQHLINRARESGDMGDAALKALDSLRAADPGAREALRKELERTGLNARPAASKSRLLRALGRLKDKESLPAMVEAMDDPDQSVERSAILAIGGLGRDARPAMGRLVKAYQGGNTGTRNAVVHALGSMGGQEALGHLKTWQQEEGLEPSVQRMLRQAILSVRHRIDAKKK